MKKLRFLAGNFDKCTKERILNSPNLSNIARSTLILTDCDSCKLSFLKLLPVEFAILDLKSLWKSVKLWEILIYVMKTGSSSIDLW